MQTDAPTMEALVNARRELNTTADKLKTEYDEKRLKIEESLIVVNNAILTRLSARSGMPDYMADGTVVSRKVDVKVSVDDWDAYHKYVGATANFDLLQKQAKRNGVVDAVNKALPDGFTVQDFFSGRYKPDELPPFPAVPGATLHIEYVTVVKEKAQ